MDNEFNSIENTQDSVQDTEEGYTKDSRQTPVDGNVKKQEEVPAGRRLRNSIIELCVYIAIIIICVAFVPKYVLQRTIVDGKSMMNTLKNGENLLVEKVSYHFYTWVHNRVFAKILFYLFIIYVYVFTLNLQILRIYPLSEFGTFE